MNNSIEIIKLKVLVRYVENNSKIDDGTWLDHLNPSQAFLTCLGAGPWKIARRTLIQKEAIHALGDRDLTQINDIKIFRFPLDWQNKKIAAIIDYLQRYKISMSWFVRFIADMNEPAKILYDVTQTSGRAKVLDLFIRDYLKLPSFPIDRHVERELRRNGFPVSEKYMINLCKEAELDVSYVARVFVSAAGKFTGNGKI